MLLKNKILVVDDHIEFAESLKDLLEAQGYDVDIAYSGLEALDKINKEQFAVVLMDTKMPGMSGVEALKVIKKDNPSIYVVLITGFSVEDVVQDAFKEGAVTVLYKPLDIPKLLQYLETFLSPSV